MNENIWGRIIGNITHSLIKYYSMYACLYSFNVHIKVLYLSCFWIWHDIGIFVSHATCIIVKCTMYITAVVSGIKVSGINGTELDNIGDKFSYKFTLRIIAWMSLKWRVLSITISSIFYIFLRELANHNLFDLSYCKSSSEFSPGSLILRHIL